MTPNSILNTLAESAMDGRTKTGEEGGAPRRSSEPSPCRSKRHTFWGQVRQLRKTNGASLPSPFDARQFARDRRGGGGKRSGASGKERVRCGANYSRPLFSLILSSRSSLALFLPRRGGRSAAEFRLRLNCTFLPFLPPSIHPSVSTHAHGILSADE